MEILAYPWTSRERMGREYPPTWEGGVARVCRGCAGAYLCKRLNPQRKRQKTLKKLKINTLLLHLPLNSNVFMKTQCFCKGALRVQPRKRPR